MADKLPGVFDLTPMNPAFNDDPHTPLSRLREECPVHRDETAGTFILTKYADVRSVVSDTSMLRGPQHAEEAAVFQRALVDQRTAAEREEDGVGSILFLDDPDHARIRKPLSQALYKRVAKSKPMVQEVVDGWLDRVAGEKTFDVMSRFAVAVPIDVIARILGVENARLAEFREWSEGIILSLNPFRNAEETERMQRCAEALTAYMRAAMDARRTKPEDDLITDMVQLQAEGAPLTDSEVSVNLQSLLIGGNLTTTDLIGSGIWLLLKHPEELAKLRADPSLINGTVEEILRYESPIDITSRIAPRDMEVRGCPVKHTQSMLTSLRGANRDPEVFEDPNRFDISRKGPPHVSFGGGAHLCIGAPLARQEAQVAILTFFQRFQNVRLADPAMKPQWRNLPFFRGMKELVVAI